MDCDWTIHLIESADTSKMVTDAPSEALSELDLDPAV